MIRGQRGAGRVESSRAVAGHAPRRPARRVAYPAVRGRSDPRRRRGRRQSEHGSAGQTGRSKERRRKTKPTGQAGRAQRMMRRGAARPRDLAAGRGVRVSASECHRTGEAGRRRAGRIARPDPSNASSDLTATRGVGQSNLPFRECFARPPSFFKDSVLTRFFRQHKRSERRGER